MAGIGAGFVAIGVPVANLLIKSWFSKARQLEELKAQNTIDLLDSFRRDINNIGSMCRDLRDRMVKMDSTLHNTQSSIDTSEMKMKSMTRVMEATLDTAKIMSENMSDLVQARVRSEVDKMKINLTDIRKDSE